MPQQAGIVAVVVVVVVVVVVAGGMQGLCAQEPGRRFVAPGCLAQLAGVNCPHSNVPSSGMQQITLSGGPFPWSAATVWAAGSVSANAVASMASARTA